MNEDTVKCVMPGTIAWLALLFGLPVLCDKKGNAGINQSLKHKILQMRSVF